MKFIAVAAVLISLPFSIALIRMSPADARDKIALGSSDREPITLSERTFAEEGRHLLEQIIGRGTAIIGELDLRDLLKRSKSIDWRVRQHGSMAGSGDNRQTAEHLVEEHQVTMSRENLQIVPWRTRPLLSLHETWGALGVEDESYQRTLGLVIYVYFRNDLLDPRKFPAGFQNVIAGHFDAMALRTQNPVYQSALGGTSVGSGGDGTALDFKMALLLYAHPLALKFPELFNGDSSRLLQKVLNARFEINLDASKEAPKFERDGKTVVVRISGAKWRNGYDQHDANPISLSQWQMMLETLRQLESYP